MAELWGTGTIYPFDYDFSIFDCLFFSCRMNDSGMYQCVATNDIGQDVAEINLTVHGESKFIFFM